MAGQKTEFQGGKTYITPRHEARSDSNESGEHISWNCKNEKPVSGTLDDNLLSQQTNSVNRENGRANTSLLLKRRFTRRRLSCKDRVNKFIKSK